MSSKFKSFISGIDQISANLEMKDGLNDKAEARVTDEHPSVQFPDHVIREYFALEPGESLPVTISSEEKADIEKLVAEAAYE